MMLRTILPFIKRRPVWLVVIILLVSGQISQAQWLKASGKRIVSDSGNEILLRGMGLGGWMLQEPYMLEMSDFATTQWQIRSKIQSLIGEQNTQAFYDAWLANHCTRRDIDSMAAWGFNSVRLPMHYNLFTLPIEKEPLPNTQTWLEKGFALTDSLVAWCKANHMYVILDLHAAPGGQGHDAAICDGDASKPSLWDSEANKQKTIELWKKLAERYANEPWVGGYDLLNEPNWGFTAGGNQNGCSENTNAPLRKLLIDITNAIRQVDNKHLIIIEGNCWGNNYNGIFPLWDNNMALSFHKYWSTNDQNSISGIINLRTQYSVPIWLGESGENSNVWFNDAIRLFEKNDIGWAWWPLKKIGSVVGPMTVVKTPEYQSLLDYWKNGGTAPDLITAKEALMQMAENTNAFRCLYHKDVTDAMFRQVSDSSAIPFKQHTLPGTFAAAEYDLGRMGKAYFDVDAADYHVSSGSYTTWNSGYVFRNDGVDIGNLYMPEPWANGFYVGWTSDNEWLQYAVDVDSTAAYSAQLKVASPVAGPVIRLQADESDVCSPVLLPATGGYQAWSTVEIPDIVLYKGRHRLRVLFEKSGCNFSSAGFFLSKNTSEIPLKATMAETATQSELIFVSFNKLLKDTLVPVNGFTCTVNGISMPVSSVNINQSNHSQLILGLSPPVYDIDEIRLSYSGSNVSAVDGTLLQQFSDLKVKNNLPVYAQIPGKIEAESYSFNYGLQFETTTDVGGGQNAGYTNAGDFLDYRIRVMKTADYAVELRVACKSDAGILEIQQLNQSDVVVHSVRVNVPVTGGWQTWKTISASLRLDAGICTLRVKIIQPEFNFNWFRFTDNSTGIDETASHRLNLFPNPAHGEVLVQIPGTARQIDYLLLRSVSGIVIRKIKIIPGSSRLNFSVGDLPHGLYILEAGADGQLFRTKLIVQ